MFYEVIEITETAWGEDKILRGRFDTLAQAVDFIEATFEEDFEDVYISDAWGEVVDF